jgi:hypothetical protein
LWREGKLKGNGREPAFQRRIEIIAPTLLFWRDFIPKEFDFNLF